MLVRLDSAKRIPRADVRAPDRVVTDIGGYFAGWRHRRPKVLAASQPQEDVGRRDRRFCREPRRVACGLAALDLGKAGPLLLLGAALSVISQCGDLLRVRGETAVWREGIPVTSSPAMAGPMDRLDGFVAAVVVAAIFGLLRVGRDGAGFAVLWLGDEMSAVSYAIIRPRHPPSAP